MGKQMILNGNMNNDGRKVETYFPFHIHTDMSFLDGFSKPVDYLRRCSELGLKSIGYTEHGNLFSAPYFGKLKKEYPEIKQVLGCEMYESFDMSIKDKDSKYFHLIALAKNERGRIALNELITRSNFEGFYYKPRVDIEALKPYTNDLIFTSACLASKLAREKDYDKCVEYITEYKNIMLHFYLEMQSHKSLDQVEHNKKILKLSQDTDTPFVITCDAHASTEQELYYQNFHVKIAKDIDTANELYDGCYLQSVDEIYETMTPQIGIDNVTKGLQETLNILNMIDDNVSVPFQEPKLPTVTFDNQTPIEKMNEIVWEGFESRKIAEKYPDKVQEYKDRIKEELDVIYNMGFESYFLIVYDFVKYAKDNGQPVGDARGSGGGSLVTYLMNITNINPIKYGLIFERFLNKERISYPDLDCDFSDQQSIISYLEGKYGEHNVCRVVNFSYITPKVAIKDVGDVLGIAYNVRDAFSKYFPSSDFDEDYRLNKIAIDKYISENPEYSEWFNIAKNISGKVRQSSIHACAVGIVDSNISQYMPILKGESGERVIQADMKTLEAMGIVKMDVLGIKTLDVVKQTLSIIGKDTDFLDINDDSFICDEKTYDLLASGDTDGVFQVESYGMKELFKRLRAKNIGEISDGISLYRPDSMNALEDYLTTKEMSLTPKYIHEDMKPILESTYGKMLYQEQLLDIVKKFGGRTYGGADLFRKGIGKKDMKVVQEESAKLKDEIFANGYSRQIADIISTDLSQKGGYLFNKSHGVGYAMLVYKTAYLKANYPIEYMTSLLNSEIGNFEKLSKYILNAQNMGIEVLPPSINKSSSRFSIADGKILFGINMIKGVGDILTQKILDEREISKFKSFEDFIERVRPDKGSMVAIIKSGMIGGKKTDMLKKYCDSIFERREFTPLVTTSGYTVGRLKDELGIDTKDKEERLKLFNEFKKKEFDLQQKDRLKKHRDEFVEKYMQDYTKWEFNTLSMYLTNNPFKEGLAIIRDFDSYEDGDRVTVIGTVTSIDKKKGKSGQYAFMEFYNGSKTIELILWSNIYAKYSTKILKGSDIAVIGIKSGDKLTVSNARPYISWAKEKGLIK